MSQDTPRTTVLNQGFGCEAYTYLDLEGGHCVCIHTMKHHTGGLQTTATLTTGVCMVGVESRDFYAVLIKEPGPVTDDAVRMQHERAIAQADGLKARIDSYYAALEEKAAALDCSR